MAEPSAAPVAMILAAGLGTRLRPMTDHLPKPLLPIRGKPLLSVIIDNLRAAGCRDFVINTHHLPGQIGYCVARRADRDRCTLLHEPRILGTGGALVNARRLLRGSADILLHNGDVLSDAPLADLVARHRGGDALATLLMVDWPQVNSVALAPDSDAVLGFGSAPDSSGARMSTYTGIAMLSRAFLEYLPSETPCSLIDGFRAAIADRPDSVRGWAPDIVWNDLGTLERFRDAETSLRDGDFDGLPGLPPAGEKDRATSLPDGASLTLLPPEADALQAAAGFDARIYGRPLDLQGSDRGFARVGAGDRTAVLMHDPEAGDELRRFLEIGAFLHGGGLGAPAILAQDPPSGLALLEDLGDRSLAAASAELGEAEKLDLYRRVLDRLLDLQAAGGAAPRAAIDRVFGREDLLWESGYFRAWFLEKELGLCGAGSPDPALEFERLAVAVDAQPKVLMHRDFQSRNIMIRDGAVRLIDFQGMRLGPYAYDPASLLRDPYNPLSRSQRRRLLEYYGAGLAASGTVDAGPDRVERDFLLAGLQRNMQALGAYARLSIDKGRDFYRAFFVPGLDQLRDGLADVAELRILDGGLEILGALVEDAARIIDRRSG